VLLFGYALSWVFATVGLAVGDPETAQAAAFPVLAPLCSPRPCSSRPAPCLAGYSRSPSTSRCR
jgi:hypothetical protein